MFLPLSLFVFLFVIINYNFRNFVEKKYNFCAFPPKDYIKGVGSKNVPNHYLLLLLITTTTIIYLIAARERPAVEIHPAEPQIVYVGNEAILYCYGGGIPEATLTWRRTDGKPLSPRHQEVSPGNIQ